MASELDDWDKPRSHGTGLTDQEIAMIRAAYKADRKIKDVARELKCASRTVSKYYGFFSAEGITRNKQSVPLRLPKQIEGSIISAPSKSKLMGGR